MVSRWWLVKASLCCASALLLFVSAASAADDEKKEEPAKQEQKEDAAAEGEKKTADPSGTWQWTREMGGQEVVTTLTLDYKDGKLTGEMKSPMGAIAISGGEVDGDKVSFEVVLMRQGLEIPLYFEGTVGENEIDGVIEVDFAGNVQEFPWKPTRTCSHDDVVGTWLLRIETDDGQVFEPSVIITAEDGEASGDAKPAKVLKGKYNSQLGEAECTDLAIEGADLVFSVKYEGDGQVFLIKMKGTPKGSEYNGTVDYDLGGATGSLPFTGKKQEEKKEEKKEEPAAEEKKDDAAKSDK